MQGGSLTHTNANVGLYGIGTVNVTGGLIYSLSSVAIGTGATGTGTVTVSGSEASWTSHSTLFVGYSGSGSLTISDGGSFSNVSTYIARNDGSDGTVAVSGAGSIWIFDNVQIGASGAGRLTVSSGGIANGVGAGTLYIGANATGTGTVDISGTGSIFKNNGRLNVGWNGTGALTINNGGSVVVNHLGIQNTSYVNMGNAASLSILDTGNTGSANITAFLGLVDGTDEIRYWNGAVWTNITAGTEGHDYSLTHHTSGDLNGYTSLIIPIPGTIVLLIVASAGLLIKKGVNED